MNSKTATITGALIASVISFLTALSALLSNNVDLTLGAISNAAWVSMGVGALVQFLKDYQAISTRNVIDNIKDK